MVFPFALVAPRYSWLLTKEIPLISSHHLVVNGGEKGVLLFCAMKHTFISRLNQSKLTNKFRRSLSPSHSIDRWRGLANFAVLPSGTGLAHACEGLPSGLHVTPPLQSSVCIAPRQGHGGALRLCAASSATPLFRHCRHLRYCCVRPDASASNRALLSLKLCLSLSSL